MQSIFYHDCRPDNDCRLLSGWPDSESSHDHVHDGGLHSSRHANRIAIWRHSDCSFNKSIWLSRYDHNDRFAEPTDGYEHHCAEHGESSLLALLEMLRPRRKCKLTFSR